MTFEEWWEFYVAQNAITNDSYIDTKEAWDFQQNKIEMLEQRIAELEKQNSDLNWTISPESHW